VLHKQLTYLFILKVVERTTKARAARRHEKIQEYFYGLGESLYPHKFDVRFTDVHVYKVGGSLFLSISQSINAEFVGRRYTTRPGAPAESVKSTIKKYILESFSKCTGISNIMKVGWKSVSGGWTGVEEATFTKSCSLRNVGL